MTAKRILIVDDDPDVRESLEMGLRREGYDVTTADSGESALQILKEIPADLILTDLKMAAMDGIDVLRQARLIDPRVVGIILTGYGTIETAVEAMKSGAFDYLSKPCRMAEVLMTVRRALEYQALRTENLVLKKNLKTKYRFDNLVGDSPPMRRVFELMEKVADSGSTILVQGESGTGKELVAKTLHVNSRRCDGPFITLDCGAMPEDLLESELFGHERGAFTGATSRRIGRLEMADGGTVFVDEIGEMSANLQVKLLRFLQEREIDRLGGTKAVKVDVRIIAATQKDLGRAVEQGTFRADLYYRLNVIPIVIPPLRERVEDIPLLVGHFIPIFNKEKGKAIDGLSPEALEQLTRYHWPGNIRELQNLLERLTILKADGMILPSDLPNYLVGSASAAFPAGIRIPEAGINFVHTVNEFENHLILQALEKSGWVKNRAAQLLNLNRTTLVEKIKKKKLSREPMAGKAREV